MQADALNRAEKLDKDIESRRSDMFGDLQKQREDPDKAVIVSHVRGDLPQKPDQPLTAAS